MNTEYNDIKEKNIITCFLTFVFLKKSEFTQQDFACIKYPVSEYSTS